MNDPFLPKLPKLTPLRVVGSILVVVGIAGLLWTQVNILAAPCALASEAPDRHLGRKETYTPQEAYTLSFKLADDIRRSLQLSLWPIIPLLLGGYLLIVDARRK